MTLNRRHMLKLMAAAAAAPCLHSLTAAQAAVRPEIKAIAFDAFPIFDPRPIFARAEKLFPGKGAELGRVWRARQFEYQWLRALSGQYEDFWQATEAALIFAARSLQLDLTEHKRGQLMQAYLALKAWPEAPQVLKALRAAGLRLVFLSNMTPTMLRAGVEGSGLDGVFEHLISTDRAKTYKPDPRAYRLGVETLGLKSSEILFVAFAGWDVAGAKWFGYPTFWVNRLGSPVEQLGKRADAQGRDLNDLLNYMTV